MMLTAYGVNLFPQIMEPEFDVYCPQLPGVPGVVNFFSSSCAERKKEGVCKPDCRAKYQNSANYHEPLRGEVPGELSDRVVVEIACPRCGTMFTSSFTRGAVQRHETDGIKLPWRLCAACNYKRKQARKEKLKGGLL